MDAKMTALPSSLILLTLYLLLSTTVNRTDATKLDPGLNVSFLLNNFQIGYDRRVRPNYGGIPVTVGRVDDGIFRIVKVDQLNYRRILIG